jgi:hypothetical protein
MLSPNAMNRVRLNDGKWVTRTVIEHTAVRLRLSLAVQSTRVSPDGNLVPDAGVHDTVTGDSPLAVAGVGYVTNASAVIVCAVINDAHVMLGASAIGTVVVVDELVVDVGVVGLLLHPDITTTTRATHANARRGAQNCNRAIIRNTHCNATA